MRLSLECAQAAVAVLWHLLRCLGWALLAVALLMSCAGVVAAGILAARGLS